MTYGQIRLRLQKLQSLDLELIDGWIQDAHTEILDALPWKRREDEATLQAPDSYAVGTITATQGSNVITGAGTVWTSAMNGRRIRLDNQREYYQFTQVGATAGTLDRTYEAPTASGLSYRIDQAVFELPADCRQVRAVRALHDRIPPLEIISPQGLNRIASGRTTYGTPRYAAPTWDSTPDPPQLQIELYPVPDSPNSSSSGLSWLVDAIFDAAALDPNATAFSLLPWIRPGALLECVQAKACRWRADKTPSEASAHLATAGAHNAEYGRLLGMMTQINAQQLGPEPMRMADKYTRRQSGFRPHKAKHEGWI